MGGAIGGSGGGGGGGGAKNYFSNGTFETSTNGVLVYNDGTYTDGTGGVVGTEFQISVNGSATRLLEGSNSLLVQKAGVDVSGFGYSFEPDTIDPIDRGKELVLKFAYKSDANIADADYEVKAYDITNAEIITGIRAINGANADNTLIPGTTEYKFGIQTKTTTADLRVSVHVASDSMTGTGAFLSIDELSLGPADPITVANVGDWQSYTPA